jgi:predicted HicB family RNase H-like nuclease
MPRPQRTSSRKRKSLSSSSSTSRDEPQKRQKQEISLTTTDSNSVRVENEKIHATTSLQAATKTQWTLNSLVSNVVTEEYNRQDMAEFVNDDLALLIRNRIKTLKQWASLSEESKEKFPVTLRDILDDASLSQGTSFDF